MSDDEEHQQKWFTRLCPTRKHKKTKKPSRYRTDESEYDRFYDVQEETDEDMYQQVDQVHSTGIIDDIEKKVKINEDHRKTVLDTNKDRSVNKSKLNSYIVYLEEVIKQEMRRKQLYVDEIDKNNKIIADEEQIICNLSTSDNDLLCARLHTKRLIFHEKIREENYETLESIVGLIDDFDRRMLTAKSMTMTDLDIENHMKKIDDMRTAASKLHKINESTARLNDAGEEVVVELDELNATQQEKAKGSISNGISADDVQAKMEAIRAKSRLASKSAVKNNKSSLSTIPVLPPVPTGKPSSKFTTSMDTAALVPSIDECRKFPISSGPPALPNRRPKSDSTVNKTSRKQEQTTAKPKIRDQI